VPSPPANRPTPCRCGWPGGRDGSARSAYPACRARVPAHRAGATRASAIRRTGLILPGGDSPRASRGNAWSQGCGAQGRRPWPCPHPAACGAGCEAGERRLARGSAPARPLGPGRRRRPSPAADPRVPRCHAPSVSPAVGRRDRARLPYRPSRRCSAPPNRAGNRPACSCAEGGGCRHSGTARAPRRPARGGGWRPGPRCGGGRR